MLVKVQEFGTGLAQENAIFVLTFCAKDRITLSLSVFRPREFTSMRQGFLYALETWRCKLRRYVEVLKTFLSLS